MRCPVCDQEYGHLPGCPEDTSNEKKGYCITYKDSIVRECTVFAKSQEEAIQKFHLQDIYNIKIVDVESQIECVERTN